MEWGTGPSIEAKEESISVVECTYRCLVFSINVHPHPFIIPCLIGTVVSGARQFAN